MTRLEALEAVVEAARAVLRERLGVDAATWEVACARLADALAVLDARTEARQTVTLAVWATSDGAVAFVTPGTRCDHPDHPLDRRLGIVTLPLDREAGR